MSSMGAWSSNKLSWFDLKIDPQNSSNGHPLICPTRTPTLCEFYHSASSIDYDEGQQIFMSINRCVTIHRWLAMHQYFVTTIHIDTADPVYCDSHKNYMHRFSSEGSVKTHTFFWSDWWKYADSVKSRFGSTSGSCSSRYSNHWSSRLCAVLQITGVPAFMLLTTSF